MRVGLYLFFWRKWLLDSHPVGHPVEAFLYAMTQVLRPRGTML